MKIGRRQFMIEGVGSLAAWRLRQIASRAQLVQWMWSGALSAESITIKARLFNTSNTVRVIFSTNEDLSSPLASQPVGTDSTIRIATISLNGLTPATQYHYAIQVDGQLDDLRGRFRTPGIDSYSFTVCFASCARSNSTSFVFRRIAELDPLLFIHMGDMHYEDIAVNDPARYHAAYDMVLSSASQAPMYQNVPIAYMWDDHDYGPNNSDKSSPSRSAARQAYQEAVPHHPLVSGSGDVPIYRAFTIGRVRFILTDLRSERDSLTVPANDPDKTMMGAAQKAWFKSELLAAQQTHAAIVWVSTVAWLADFPGAGADKWNGFAVERQELADFIYTNNINKLFFISGDVHMLAADDGRNNRYAAGATRGFPIFQAAALDQGGSFLSSNQYSEGQWPREHQFGILNITDDGGASIGVEYIGRNIWFGDRIQLKLPCPYLFHDTFLPLIMR